MFTQAPKREALSKGEFDQLDEFLLAIGPSAMSLEELDGFLTALIVGPELVLPSEYWPEIFGDERFDFKTEEEARNIFGLVARHWNTISTTLDAQDIYEPILIQDEKGVATGKPWATGFMYGVQMRFEHWRSFIEDDETAGLILPIIMLAHEGDVDPKLRTPTLTPEKRESVLISVAASLPQIFKFFQAMRIPEIATYKRSEPKVGRNDPCPCGSGKKFKSCCGAKSTQH